MTVATKQSVHVERGEIIGSLDRALARLRDEVRLLERQAEEMETKAKPVDARPELTLIQGGRS